MKKLEQDPIVPDRHDAPARHRRVARSFAGRLEKVDVAVGRLVFESASPALRAFPRLAGHRSRQSGNRRHRRIPGEAGERRPRASGWPIRSGRACRSICTNSPPARTSRDGRPRRRGRRAGSECELFERARSQPTCASRKRGDPDIARLPAEPPKSGKRRRRRSRCSGRQARALSPAAKPGRRPAASPGSPPPTPAR